MRFLDTNVLIRYLTRDDEDKAERALTVLLNVEGGGESVATSPMVIFETVFVLEKGYNTARETIRERMEALISLRGLRLHNKHIYLRALNIYVEHPISFADAYNAAFMRANRIAEIYTWDTDFDRLDGIRRVEPGANITTKRTARGV